MLERTRKVPVTKTCDVLFPFQIDPGNNLKFTGRNDVLNSIHSTFRQENTQDSPNIVVLHGPGGIGKTQIAAKYAYLHREDFEATFWVDGTSKDSICRGFVSIATKILKHHIFCDEAPKDNQVTASKLGFSNLTVDGNFIPGSNIDYEQIVMSVKTYFSDTEMKISLVFDGVDDPGQFDIKRYFLSPAKILLTSRRRDVASLGVSIEVEEMVPEEALTMLKSSAGLVHELGNRGMSPYTSEPSVTDSVQRKLRRLGTSSAPRLFPVGNRASWGIHLFTQAWIIRTRPETSSRGTYQLPWTIQK